MIAGNGNDHLLLRSQRSMQVRERFSARRMVGNIEETPANKQVGERVNSACDISEGVHGPPPFIQAVH